MRSNRKKWTHRLSALGAVSVLVACGSAANPEAATDDAVGRAHEAVTSGCADGTTEQAFASGMIGCAGTVTWDKRATLCAPGYHPASANEWTSKNLDIAPTHHYWTNEDLRYSGSGLGSCWATRTGGSSCGENQPMHVCARTRNDAEGNTCNWTECGLESNTNQYFGGCIGNTTAGTLCVPTGCEDGTVEQTFARGLVGCAAPVTWDERDALCAPGYRVATAEEWVDYNGGIAPTHNYWTLDDLKYSGSANSCSAGTSGSACPSLSPMRVCTPNHTDAEGNTCNWANCGFNASSPNEYFGGCFGNTTAGALCIPIEGCADGSTEQIFANGVVGCAGVVTWDQRNSLCAPGWSAITALEWSASHGAEAPSHAYWTNDDLKFSGTGTSNCFVSTTSGSKCPAHEPMHVCPTSGKDGEGNQCTWTNCGIDANSPNEYYGGCFNNTTAGTLCAKGDPTTFTLSAFPLVEITSWSEKTGIDPVTHHHFAGADVSLVITNTGAAETAPIWLSITDVNALLEQDGSPIAFPSLMPGASQTVSLHMSAVVQSGLSEDQQYAQWQRSYDDHCGADLHGVMDWRGPQSQAPLNPHKEVIVAPQGWSDYAKIGPSAQICDGQQCVSTCAIATNIHAQLDGHAVGYSFFAGQYPKFDAHGDARTAANGTAIPFNSQTKITVASVSKLVTAIAAVRILDARGISVDAAIGPYLPADWAPADYVKKLTFAQLMSHTSGIKNYGNVTQDYAALKAFFTQPVDANATTTCQGPAVTNLPDAINPNDLTPCYSNFNFAIFRLLLPKVVGFVEDANPSTRPQTLADQYVTLVQQNEFERVGQYNVSCKPPAGSTNYAFAYKYPGDAPGTDWGDVTLQCGAAGWYLSIEDMSKVLMSINAKDGKILAANPMKDLFETMRQKHLGWDLVTPTELEKNGGWGANCDQNGCDTISTSVAIFGPETGPRVLGVLFLNSNVSGGSSNGAGADAVLYKAYTNALTPSP